MEHESINLVYFMFMNLQLWVNDGKNEEDGCWIMYGLGWTGKVVFQRPWKTGRSGPLTACITGTSTVADLPSRVAYLSGGFYTNCKNLHR